MVKHSAHLVGNMRDYRQSSSIACKFLLSITLIVFISLILLLNNVSAANDGKTNNGKKGEYLLDREVTNTNWDNYKRITQTNNKYPGIEVGGYFGLGQSSKFVKASLLSNTEHCDQNCEAIFTMDIGRSSAAVSKIQFYEMKIDGSKVLRDIPFHAVYIKLSSEADSEYIPYTLGIKVKPGNYTIKIIGKKESAVAYDWVITSNEMTFDEWAPWGMNINSWCYQESANTTDQGAPYGTPDGICGLNYTGKYTWYNGPKPTSNYININYSRPFNATNASLWSVKVSNIDAYNLSIPSGCWGDILQLRIYSSSRNLTYSYGLTQCFNRTDSTWITFGPEYSDVTGANGSVIAYDASLSFDGNWSSFTSSSYTNDTDNNWTTIEVDQSSIFEEAMVWAIPYYNRTVNLVSPIDSFKSIGNNINFSCTVNASSLTPTQLTNISLYTDSTGPWKVNQTTVVTGFSNFSTFNVTFETVQSVKWACQACDTDSDCDFSSTNRTVYIDGSAVNTSVISYNQSSYETKREVFNVNVSWNNVTYSSMNATFYYDNIRYLPISNKSNTNTTAFRVAVDIPLVSTKQNYSFYWMINLTDSLSNSYYVNSSIYQQTVSPIYFQRCNDTITRPYLNITFYDEITSVNSAEQLVFGTNYSIGNFSSTVRKQLNFDSGAELNQSYMYCFFPTNESILLENFNIRYGAITATPPIAERTSSYSTYALPNSTQTNLSLYSLSSGNFITFTIQDNTGSILSDVETRITTLVGGTKSTTVGIDYTDTSGQVVFYLSSLVDYTLYLNKSGCISKAVTLRPTYSAFTYQMDCGTGGVPLILPYIGTAEGITYRSTPPSGVIVGDTEFGLRVYSTKYNINEIRLELMNMNFSLIEGHTKAVDNITCYPQDCMINFTSNVSDGSNLKGRYLVNITVFNGSTTMWYTLEQEAYWTKYINWNQSGSNLKRFWNDFGTVFDSWNSYTGSADEANRAEFSRIIFIFLIMALLIAAFNKMTGYDSANPGAFLGLLSGIFWLGSFAGSRSCAQPGFFYLSGLFGNDMVGGICSKSVYMLNNYIIAISVFIMFLTYIINVQRRNS
jgi:hypothetical protein